jgi:hypothetical protein
VKPSPNRTQVLAFSPFLVQVSQSVRALLQQDQGQARQSQVDADLTGWLWTGLIERISLDQRSWE